MKNIYDLREDFKQVEDVLLRESLSEEDVLDGLEPMDLDLKVALTHHAYDRMYNTYGRDTTWAEVESLIEEKSDKLFDVRSGDEFILLSEDEKLALVCEMHQQEGMTILVLITVIQKIYKSQQGEYLNKKVYVNRQSSMVY